MQVKVRKLKNCISIVKTFEGMEQLHQAEHKLSESAIYQEYRECRDYILLFNNTAAKYTE